MFAVDVAGPLEVELPFTVMRKPMGAVGFGGRWSFPKPEVAFRGPDAECCLRPWFPWPLSICTVGPGMSTHHGPS